MIDEMKQIKAYKLIRPSLEEHEWTLHYDPDSNYARWYIDGRLHHMTLPLFYTMSGPDLNTIAPDINTLVYEFMPVLMAEGVSMSWGSNNSMHEGKFILAVGDRFRLFIDQDPYVAITDWMELKPIP